MSISERDERKSQLAHADAMPAIDLRFIENPIGNEACIDHPDNVDEWIRSDCWVSAGDLR